MRRKLFLLGLALALTPQLAAQQGAPEAIPPRPTLTASSTSNVEPDRLITLAELGHGEGIRFTGLEGQRQVYFAVQPGPWLRAMRLQIPYISTAAAPGARTLTVTVGDRLVQHVSLAQSGVIDIEVPTEAIRDGTVRVGFDYGGAWTPNRCFDERVAADLVLLDPRGGLALSVDGRAPMPVAAATALMPRDPLIVLPPKPNERQAAAALTVVAARGGDILIGNAPQPLPSRGLVLIGSSAEPTFETIARDGIPAIKIGGSDPAAAARSAFSPWGNLLASPAPIASARESGSILLSELGVDPRPIEVGEEGGWSFALPATRLGPKRSIRELAVELAAVPDSSGRPATASAWMNGRLLGTAPISGAQPTRLEFGVPEGLVQTMNGFEVRVTRAYRADCGERRRTWPAQLMGSSELVLGDSGPLHDFSRFAAEAAEGLTVVVPNATALPLAARPVAALATVETPISVSYGRLADAGAALFVGTEPPPGQDMPVRIEQGRAVVTTPAGERTFQLPAGEMLTIAALSNSSDSRPLLWVRPGSRGPATMWLDRGDVAFVSPDGKVNAMSSHRERLYEVGTVPGKPDRPWLQRSWPWIAGGALLVALILAWSFAPSVKRGRGRRGDD